jgi:hypothetical protein
MKICETYKRLKDAPSRDILHCSIDFESLDVGHRYLFEIFCDFSDSTDYSKVPGTFRHFAAETLLIQLIKDISVYKLFSLENLLKPYIAETNNVTTDSNSTNRKVIYFDCCLKFELIGPKDSNGRTFTPFIKKEKRMRIAKQLSMSMDEFFAVFARYILSFHTDHFPFDAFYGDDQENKKLELFDMFEKALDGSNSHHLWL